MKERASVYLIGAGGFGIRHFEGLLKVTSPLAITVIDRSLENLEKAHALVTTTMPHTIRFEQHIPTGTVDIAIIATTSGNRSDVIQTLLSKNTVRFMILEKILFTKETLYTEIDALLEEKNISTWVNCPLRIMPVRREMKDMLDEAPFSLHISGGSAYGLMTNCIHYADYASYLSGSTDFEIDTSMLSPEMLESKRDGYKELQGSLALSFSDGSEAIFTTLRHPHPRRTTVSARSIRATFEEPVGIAQISRKDSGWKWEETAAPLLYQSDMTGTLVDNILRDAKCDLPTYADSATLHLKLLKPIQKFLAHHGHTFDTDFPFT